jgi:hypothetical protein
MLFLYLTTVAATIVAEHLTFGRWWKNNELARRTLGHATILAISLLFVTSGLFDLTTLLYLIAGTGVAGAITAAFAVHENERRRNERAEARRNEGLQNLS